MTATALKAGLGRKGEVPEIEVVKQKLPKLMYMDRVLPLKAIKPKMTSCVYNTSKH